ncbi:MAG: ABC transporter substrate-binding protein [Alphaproteobacteria bacterium]|nr:ABC transporter substrate-binding protein [Alphaproteobacteria bacterium]
MTGITRRGLMANAAASLGAASLAAPALAQSERTRVLRFIPQIDLVFLDPVFSMTNITRNHAGLVFDRLYSADNALRAHPQMAEGHTIDNDGLRWTIKLRDGLRFHDGEPVLARDAVASLRRWGKRDVLGIELMAATDELSAPDDRTIVFRLKRPFPLLAEALAKPGANMSAIMPARLAETDPFKQITEMVGSGPFKYVANERLQGVRNVYEKFHGYVPRQGGTPNGDSGPKIVHFERIVWTTMPDQGTALVAMQKGEQDWWEYAAQDLLPIVRRDRNLRSGVLEKLGNFAFIRFNHTQPPFNNPEIRRVILRAVNQEDFTAAIAGGEPDLQNASAAFFPPGTPDHSDTGLETLRPRYTNAQAKAALEAAGYKGEKIVCIVPGDYPNLKAASEVLADMLKRIGINLDVVTTDWATMTTRVIKRDLPNEGGFHLHMLNVPGLSVASPLVNSRVRGVAANESGWYNSPRYEALRAEWMLSPDASTRQRLAGEIQREFVQSVPMAPCGVTYQPAAWRADLDGVLEGVPKFWNVKRV